MARPVTWPTVRIVHPAYMTQNGQRDTIVILAVKFDIEHPALFLLLAHLVSSRHKRQCTEYRLRRTPNGSPRNTHNCHSRYFSCCDIGMTRSR